MEGNTLRGNNTDKGKDEAAVANSRMKREKGKEKQWDDPINTALERLRLGISSPKPAWSLEKAYPKESWEEKGGGEEWQWDRTKLVRQITSGVE